MSNKKYPDVIYARRMVESGITYYTASDELDTLGLEIGDSEAIAEYKLVDVMSVTGKLVVK
jgi:hypothetical protein